MNETAPNLFDQRARDWDKNPGHAARNQAILAAFGRRFPLDGTLDALEAGCGTGALALNLAPSLRSVLATDASRGMIEELQAKLAAESCANIRAVQFDLLGGTVLDERFDLVYSSMMLHHVAEAGRMLGRMGELLKPEGRVALVDLLAEDGSFHGDTEVPHHGFGEGQLAALAAGAGLRLASFETIHAIAKHDTTYPLFLAILESAR